MLSRHELPTNLPNFEPHDVQTSAQGEIEADVPGITSNRPVPHIVRLLYRTDYVTVMARASATREECLEIYYKSQKNKNLEAFDTAEKLPNPSYQRQNCHKLSEPLRTDDPFPLFDFGPWSALLVAAVLASSGVAIVLGLLAIGSWIHNGMSILPLGQPW